jgi:hypothetical protein
VTSRNAVQRRSQIAWHAQRVQAVSTRRTHMFKKILIANRGDQPQRGAAAKPNCLARAACAGGFNAENPYV